MGRSRLTRALAVLAVAVPLVPIVVGWIIGSSAKSSAQTTSGFTPVGASASRTPARPASPGVPGGRGALVALVKHATMMRATPGGRLLAAVGTRTGFGSPQALWVISHVPGWLGVVSPQAGNGRVGWIPQSATTLGRVRWELKVSLAARQLTVIEDGRVLKRYTVAVGQPAAPTPTGRFAVADRLATGDPSGPYGCCILALSAKSPHAIQGWSGGNRIAIHSTPDTASIGQPVSHGCLRLTIAEGQWLMAHVPLGTPALISS
jgi:lipoprotein-anchoring transpeptidase ErfK/SrfK